MISYALQGNVAVLTMDDGKVNAVNPAFAQSMNDALDRAEKDEAGAILLQGREGSFSAGFDLKEFQKGPEAMVAQVRAGFGMLIRLFSLPRPLIAACEGHGIGMGAFMLMACDYRVGRRDAEFRYSMPESRIGMDLASLLIALAKSRISPQYLTRVAVLSEELDAENAVLAGVLDEVQDGEDVMTRALEVANAFAGMPTKFGPNKLLVREAELTEMRTFLEGFPGNSIA